MTGTVDNGAIVDVSFPFFEGRGGLVRHNDGWKLAIQSPRRPTASEQAKGGTVGGKPATIANVRDGARGSRMLVLTIEFQDGGSL